VSVARSELPRASAGRPEVVLVVEDDPNVRRYCLRCLASLGYATIEAANGPDALAALDAAGRVDLLLTDVVMPNGMNGPEVVTAATRRQPGLRVLYMSGYLAHMLDAEEQIATASVLTKPFSRASLAVRVRTLLDAPTRNVAPISPVG
jgi:CheY-like chemotaxis protein